MPLEGEEAIAKLHAAILAVEPVISSRSTTRFDGVKVVLSEILGISKDEIYVSTIDKSANANTRFQQMKIRQNVSWKVFVGVCLRSDLESTSYYTCAKRSFESNDFPEFQGTIWLSKIQGSVEGKWSPGVAHLTRGSELISRIRSTWPSTTLVEMDSRRSQVIPVASAIDSTNLEELIGWPAETIENVIEALLDRTPQVVLAGPPGTGKTFAARHIAAAILGEAGDLGNSAITLVQFHPSYGYEDFVEGLRPTLGSDGIVQFENVPGVIVQLAHEIQENDAPRVLIIDEMNRANLARVFGELMYLLEYRDSNIKLMSQEGFNLPPNLYIIGTMNTADRSIRSIDIALRRRFDFFEVAPDVEILRRFFRANPSQNHFGDELYSGFLELNLKLESELDRHHQIGHSFFMRYPLDAKALRRIWRQQVHPLLEEYFFDQPDLLSDYSVADFWPSAND